MPPPLANTLVDRFNSFPTNLEGPASNAYRIVANNSANVIYFTRAIMVGESGALNVEFVKNDINANVTMNVTSGIVYPFRIRKVWVANTTCNTIIGLY